MHRGAPVSLGYWNDPKRTAERYRPAPICRPTAWSGARVWSGDTVVADEDGFLYFVGRRDEMIKTSGYRVSPTEVEEATYAGPVRDAVAVGVPSPGSGEVVLVATAPNRDSTSTPCSPRRRDLPLFMVPWG